MESVSRFFQGAKQSFFLFGPRGSGKSTWIKKHFSHALIIDLLSPDVYRYYKAKPERLRDIVMAQPSVKAVVIDEIQKIPELLDVTHQLIEDFKDIQFVLTGSSARKLKRIGVDLMAGRALNKSMHPFMASELGGRFRLDDALTLGMLPLVIDSLDPSETLKSYLSLYLQEEVQMEGLVRNIGAFSRFLESASFSHAGVLNMSEISRECQVSNKTVEGYFSILEDLLLSFRIPVFTKRAKRNLSSHPKFYYFDAGVFRSIRPAGPVDTPQEINGASLEGLVAQHLRAWSAYSNNDCRLYFWRTKSGNEVDFILYGKDTFYAFEVKNANYVHPKSLNGLKSFAVDYPEAKTCLLYRGKEWIKEKDILCIPCEDFLKALVPGKPVPISGIVT